MSRFAAILAGAITVRGGIAAAQQPLSGGPYRVLKTARVGGEGGFDYIYATSRDGGYTFLAERRRRCLPRRRDPNYTAAPARLTILTSTRSNQSARSRRG
jgi:hypothetical protein